MVGKRFGGLERVGERPGAGQEMKDGKEGRGERQKGRVRAETGAEMSRRKPGQHILQRLICVIPINGSYFPFNLRVMQG